MNEQLTKYVYDALQTVKHNNKDVPVVYAYPDSFEKLPVITYSGGPYTNPVRTLDTNLRSYDVLFYIDIWTKSALVMVQIGEAVRDKLKSIGFTPTSLGEFYEESSKIHHLRLAANGVWDIRENRLY